MSYALGNFGQMCIFCLWMPQQFAVNKWDCWSSYCYLRRTWRIHPKSKAFCIREKGTRSVVQELLVWVIYIVHRNFCQLDINKNRHAHTFFYGTYFTYECKYIYIYIHMYGCLLPLCSSIGSNTVISVPGHSEHVFSVLIALTARSRHPVDSLNFEALTTFLLISHGTSGGWQWLISDFGLFSAWAETLAWATACPRHRGGIFDHSDAFKASHKQRGCASSWRGRKHSVDITTSYVENSWENDTKPWSFHPTSFDPCGKGCLFSFFFQ